ncbi:MAG: RDD family protein [Euzebya sp.]
MTEPRGRRSPIDRLVDPVRAAIIGSIDPNDIVERVDPNGLIDRVDVNRLLDRVDVDRLLEHVDVNRLLEQVDVNRLLDRVDPDRLMDRVDVDRFMSRLDIDAVVSRVDVDGIVASSTSRVAGSVIDVIRRQGVGLDAITMRTLQRLRGVDAATVPEGPAQLIRGTGATDRYEVTGRYAGPVTRLAANAGDVAIGFGLFTVLSAGLAYLASLLFNVEFNPATTSGLVGTAALFVVVFTYVWLSLSIAGRTPAMAILGLRVVTRDGRPVSTGRAFLRTAALPLSAVPFGLGFLGLFLGRERRGFHDLIAGCVVVYDWGDRPASLPTPLGDWLSRHDPSGRTPAQRQP